LIKTFILSMKKLAIMEILSRLNKAGVRYLIVGGLAVVYHGYSRFTSDLDLIIAFDEENILKAINTFENLGYIPRALVKAIDLCDAEKRNQ
jgi:hypothetical protein